ncbi:MAG: phytoene desaturase family protein [Actinomycetes bacterium]
MARVVVVGAGMGGLAAAARLARQRHEVTVCEQASAVGGKLGTYTRDGFTFDTGPSLLTLPAVYRDLFRKTGRPLEQVLDLVPVDPVTRYRFADGATLDLPNASRSGVRGALDDALGGTAGRDWLAVLDRGAAMWDAVREPFLSSGDVGVRDLLRRAGRVHDLRVVAPWQTLRGLGRHLLHDPRLHHLLDRYATYTGSDPRRTPAVLATAPYVEHAFGAWYVPGGLGRLGDALADRAHQRGVRLRTGAEVVRVSTSGGRVDGVVLADGETLPADVVVSDVDTASLYVELLPQPRQAARLRKATPSLSGFVLLLALRGRTPGLRHHTVLFAEDYDAEFDAVFGQPASPVPDPTLYVGAPDDPALRPDDGHEAWQVLVNAPRHGTDGAPGTVDWTAPGLAESYADRVLAVMAGRGLDVRDRVRWRVIRTPADLERETRSPGGAIYGSSSNGRRAAFLRPANRSPVPGLFLVGGSAHPGGGLPLVAMSAATVAGMVGRA